MSGEGATSKPPSDSKRARLAAVGALPYEPTVVFSAAATGMLLILAFGGPAWFELWKAFLQEAIANPNDRGALRHDAVRLLGSAIGGLLATSLLCGWGAGWMQRRLSPPAVNARKDPTLAARADGSLPTWFSWLLAAAAAVAVVGTTIVLASAWFQSPNRLFGKAGAIAGTALLTVAGADMATALLLLAWRRRRFAKQHAMGHPERQEERRSEAPAPGVRDEIRGRQQSG